MKRGANIVGQEAERSPSTLAATRTENTSIDRRCRNNSKADMRVHWTISLSLSSMVKPCVAEEKILMLEESGCGSLIKESINFNIYSRHKSLGVFLYIHLQGSFLALDIIGHMTCCQKNQSVIFKNNRS